MLERNVSLKFDWLANSALMVANLDSQKRKRKSSRSMSFLGIPQAKSDSHERRGGPDRVIERQRSQVVVVEEEGAEAGDMAEEVEGEAGILVRGPLRTGTKLRGAITTGSGVMIRRWREGAHHPRCKIVHSYAVTI